MFAIVEDQKQCLVPRDARQRLGQVGAVLLGDAECARDGPRHVSRVAERRQFHEPDAVGVRVGELRTDLQREPSLAATARSGQRHQSRGSDQRENLARLLLAAEETGKLLRQRLPADMRAVASAGFSRTVGKTEPVAAARNGLDRARPETLRREDTCTCRLFSSTTRPGHAKSSS